MMTRKDYIAFAAMLKQVGQEQATPDGAVAVATVALRCGDLFAADNERFDRVRFLAACRFDPPAAPSPETPGEWVEVEYQPLCDECGRSCEFVTESGEQWCGVCGCCAVHCQQFVECPDRPERAS